MLGPLSATSPPPKSLTVRKENKWPPMPSATTAPVADVTATFLRLFPLLLATLAALWPSTQLSVRGAALAVVSGAVTSAGGYVIWYYALRHLTAMRASILQLSVPAIAAVGGTLVLAEPVTVRLVTAATLILGGVALSIGDRGQ